MNESYPTDIFTILQYVAKQRTSLSFPLATRTEVGAPYNSLIEIQLQSQNFIIYNASPVALTS